MPLFNPNDPLAMPQLFQHQFDIDDIINALCAPTPQWLNSTNGQLSASQPSAPQTPSTHSFLIEPLPASFITNLATSPEVRLLTPPEQTSLQQLLPTLTITALPPHFSSGTRLGGWLRERVKDVALEYLDTHNLIPPSMRHINRNTQPKAVGTAGVTIISPA